MDNLLPDLVYEILLRLPAAILAKVARHVCRSWRSIISDPIFIDQHTRSFSSEDAKSLLFQQYMSGYKEVLVMYNTVGGPLESIRLRHQFHLDMNIENTVIQVCNGMVLYIHAKSQVFNFYLCNPILNQCITLPPTTLFIGIRKYCTSGFGYDSITKEYKVVLIFIDQVNRKSYLYCCTINTGTGNKKKRSTKYRYNCWREVGHIDGEVYGKRKEQFQDGKQYKGLFVDGKLHWFLCGSAFEARILYFDLNTESLKLETFRTRDGPQFLGLKLLGESRRGKLCVRVGHSRPYSSTVWVKKEEEEEDVRSDRNSNWIEESDLRNIFHNFPLYCGYWKDGLFVSRQGHTRYVIKNKTNVITDVIDCGGFFLSNFVPTLLSLSSATECDL